MTPHPWTSSLQSRIDPVSDPEFGTAAQRRQPSTGGLHGCCLSLTGSSGQESTPEAVVPGRVIALASTMTYEAVHFVQMCPAHPHAAGGKRKMPGRRPESGSVRWSLPRSARQQDRKVDRCPGGPTRVSLAGQDSLRGFVPSCETSSAPSSLRSCARRSIENRYPDRTPPLPPMPRNLFGYKVLATQELSTNKHTFFPEFSLAATQQHRSDT